MYIYKYIHIYRYIHMYLYTYIYIYINPITVITIGSDRGARLDTASRFERPRVGRPRAPAITSSSAQCQFIEQFSYFERKNLLLSTAKHC